ncbi:helix-turn-helix domain-containing protein [Rhodococcus sp. NPDC003318]|uniref:AraC family transcriptional regulator n=1 Tax=Rhodococcus sp. NPDC003318 TaxID=3364503 RepID=UPI00369A0A4C
MTDGDRRGVLYPVRLPTFHREPAPPDLAGLVRWFWIPEWDLGAGRTSRQEVLAFPASNLVVQPAGITLSGPTTTRSHRDLTGRGWAVGALLRPAAVASLTTDPRSVRDREIDVEARGLLDLVRAAMTEGDPVTRRQRATEGYAAWIAEHIDPPDPDGALANDMEDLVAADRSVTRVEHVARHLGVSVRGVQRLARRYVGVTPHAMIRRYRLQETAQRLREDPAVTVGAVAVEMGYSDQAHLCADFRSVLGFTPTTYRRRTRGDDAGE